MKKKKSFKEWANEILSPEPCAVSVTKKRERPTCGLCGQLFAPVPGFIFHVGGVEICEKCAEND